MEKLNKQLQAAFQTPTTEKNVNKERQRENFYCWHAQKRLYLPETILSMNPEIKDLGE